MQWHLTDLPDAGRYPPDRWRLPDRVDVAPVRLGSSGEVVDYVLTPIYAPADAGRTRQHGSENEMSKWADARRARGALRAFARISELDDVPGFVSRFGMLNLDRTSHLPRWPVAYPVTIPSLPDNGGRAFELAHDYIVLAQTLDKALEVLGALRRGDVKVSVLDELRDAIGTLPHVPASASSILSAIVAGLERLHSAASVETRRSQRERRARLSLSALVNWWLAAGNVCPLVQWSSGDIPELRWNGGLWGAIGSQLLVAVAEEPKHEQAPSGREIRWKSVECDHCHDEILVQRIKNGKHFCAKPKCQAVRMRNSRSAAKEKTARVQKSRIARRRS